MGQMLSPLTQTPYPDATDNAVGDLLEVPDAVLWLEKYLNLRFTSAAARDAAIPVPTRGMQAIVGSTAANSYPCWYDGAAWRGAVVELPLVDAGFPVAANLVTSETVISRITIPARDYARRFIATGVTFASYSQTGDVDLRIYGGASLLNQSRKRMESGVGETWAASTSSVGINAGASMVVDLRINKATGTGGVSTSAGISTTLQVTVTPV